MSNLSVIFVKFSYKNCNDSNCICKYSLSFNYFIKCKNFFLPCKANSNCESIGCIYIIKCMKCEVFYIGETSRRVKDRITEHMRSIVSFRNDIINSLINLDSKSETAIHFNKTGHSIENDFKFFVFESNVTNNEIRKSIETDLINFFKSFKINILNAPGKQPGVHKIKYFTFQNKF